MRKWTMAAYWGSGFFQGNENVLELGGDDGCVTL